MEIDEASIAGRLKLVGCVGVARTEDFRLPFLHHFLKHYLSVGIRPENFRITLQGNDHGPDIEAAEQVLLQYGVRAVEHRFEAYDCYGFHESILKSIDSCSSADWIVCVDFDEYVEFPLFLPALVAQLEARNLNAMRGALVDRIAKDGSLPEISMEPNIWRQFPLAAPLTSELVIGCVDKICLFKAGLTPTVGHHAIMNGEQARFARSSLNVHHFKWDASLVPRLERTRDRFRRDPQKYFWHEEVDRVLSGLRGGRISDHLFSKATRTYDGSPPGACATS